jgi:hypothetical protein
MMICLAVMSRPFHVFAEIKMVKKQPKILNWYEFSYLNGVRKNNQAAMTTYEEYLHGMQSMGIASVNGRIEKKMMLIIKEMAELNTMLTAKVEDERKRDISLWLNDI